MTKSENSDEYWTHEEYQKYVIEEELKVLQVYQKYRAKKIVENLRDIKDFHWIMTKKSLQSYIAKTNRLLGELLENAELPSYKDIANKCPLCLDIRLSNTEEMKRELKMLDPSLYRKAYGKSYSLKKPFINLCSRIKTTIMESVKRMIGEKAKEVDKK